MVKYTLLLCFILVYSGYAFAACVPPEFECPNGECRFNSSCPVPVNYNTCFQRTGLIYQCDNGDCVATYTDCPTSPTCDSSFVKCWDGSCKISVSFCPIMPSCRPLLRRCSDGTCATSCKSVSCDVTCDDGNCAVNDACPISGGCPTNAPYLCPIGWCVRDIRECRGGCEASMYLCHNGLCTTPDACPYPPPRLIYAISFDKQLEDTSTQPITILGEGKQITKIAEIQFPPSVLKSEKKQVLEVRPVADSEIREVSGKKVFGSASYTMAILSSVVSLTFNGTKHSKFEDDVIISFSDLLPRGSDTSTLCLASIDEKKNEWKCDSEVELIDGYIVGKAKHFSKFAILTGNPAGFYNLSFDQMFSVYIVIAIVGVYAACIVVSCKCMTHKRRRPSRRGQALSLRELMPDAFAPDREEFTTERERERDRDRERERDRERDRGERTSTTDDSSTFDGPHILKLSFLSFIAQTHSFVAWVFSKSYRLAPYDFLTILLFELLAHLMVSTIISEQIIYSQCFGETDTTEATETERSSVCAPAKQVNVANASANACVSACVVFCAWMFMVLVFRYAPRQRHRRKFIAYFVAIAFCLACVLGTILYANEFSSLQRQTWMVVFGIALGLESIILQAIKITISFFIVSYRRAKQQIYNG